MSLNHVTLAPVFSAALIVLLFCIALAAAAVQYKTCRTKLGNKRALIIAWLRFAAIAILAAFALNPSRVARQVHTLLPAIAVVVDTSESMGQTAAGNKTTRLDEARALLTEGESPLLRSLKEKFEVNVYGLSDSLRPLEPGDLDRLQAGGNKGDFGKALQTLSGQNAVAVLLSDGNLKWRESSVQRLPTVAVAMGRHATYRDILIKAISAPAIAFRGREVVIDVTIKSYGYAGVTLPVLLQESGRLLTAKDVRLPTDGAESTASLSFVPNEPGRKDLSISIPQQVGESIVTNNRINLTIKVVRDKIRILMVSGSPSMNYRFMRIALKSDPSIDLLSFVILRTPSDVLNVPPQEQSLIPFPVDTLFSKELVNFDLLIFDNFDYPVYLRSRHLESIRDFVANGGGFALVGGPNVYDEDKFGLTPVGEILPFRFVEGELYQRDLPVGLRLTRAGAAHPLMRFSDDLGGEDGSSFRFWQAMPTLDGINPVEAKDSATVLLQSADSNAWPILTVSEYRKGRVLALTTDYAWKWYMGMVAEGKGNQSYLRLIHGMVRWLTKDPGLDPVQMILPETVSKAGQEVDVRLQFHGEDLSRKSAAAFSFSVFNSEGAKVESKLKATAQPAEYLVSFRPPKGGIYRIRVETPFENLEESMAVAGPLESLNAAPDYEQLKRIATVTGGKYLAAEDHLQREIEGYARQAGKQFIEEKRLSIWTSPIVMAVVLALLSSEWYFRRRWGLI